MKELTVTYNIKKQGIIERLLYVFFPSLFDITLKFILSIDKKTITKIMNGYTIDIINIEDLLNKDVKDEG